jgi:hypothetical protein
VTDQNSNRSTADWLVELCVYAPIGFALDAHKYVPEFVDRGRNQVALARFLGKFALDRIEHRLGPLGTILRSASPAPPTTPAAPTEATPAASAPGGATTAARDADRAATTDAAPAAPSTPSSERRAPDHTDRSGGTVDGERRRRPGGSAKARPTAAGTVTARPPSGRRPPSSPGAQAAPTRGSGPTRARRPRPAGGSAATTGRPGAGAAGTARTARTARTPRTTTGPVTPGLATAPGADRTAGARAGRRSAPPAPSPSGELPIEGYATLAASQIVPRLTTLSATDLAAVARYERANRGRRTILNRVEQLLAER